MTVPWRRTFFFISSPSYIFTLLLFVVVWKHYYCSTSHFRNGKKVYCCNFFTSFWNNLVGAVAVRRLAVWGEMAAHVRMVLRLHWVHIPKLPSSLLQIQFFLLFSLYRASSLLDFYLLSWLAACRTFQFPCQSWAPISPHDGDPSLIDFFPLRRRPLISVSHLTFSCDLSPESVVLLHGLKGCQKGARKMPSSSAGAVNAKGSKVTAAAGI